MRNQPARRVAIVGGLRTPFCRAHSAYAECSNQDMLSAVLAALVVKYDLHGVKVDDVSAGAVIKHSRDYNLTRESVLSSGLAAETPAFDVRLTPTRMMGVISEGFRTYPGVRRSGHPQESFAACGPNADFVVDGHSLNRGLGDQSPLGRLYDVDGHILLLGVGHANNTTLHLAEYRGEYPEKEWVTQGAPMIVDGERRWVTFEDLEGNSDDFEAIGDAFAAAGLERRGSVASGEGRLMRIKDLVDFAADWMTTHRNSK